MSEAKHYFELNKVTPRRGTNSYKWDEPEEEGVIPMWVADMDFEVAPAITEALRERVDHGIFGYTMVPDSYYESIIRWYGRRHGLQLKKEWIVYTTGVVPAVSAIIKALTLPSEQVVMMTPAYNCFYSCIRNNGCEVVESPLLCTREKVDGQPVMRWTIDYDDLEKKLESPRARCLLLCNPHNPVGRVWTSDELRRVGELCKKHGVVVVSDEIHNEIVMPGYHYTPFASLSEEFRDSCVTCCSPTKGFNIAGLQIANIFCADADLRYRIDRAINLNECCDVNPFGVIALQAAYDKSEEWLDSMCEYVKGNYDLLVSKLPDGIYAAPLEGTYLAWVDITATGMTSDEFTDHLLREAKVMVSSGTLYGSDGEGFIRINLASPRALVEEAMDRVSIMKK